MLKPSRERMAGKVAIITGSAGGIGAATAELFCEAGARVALVDRNGELLGETAAGIRERVPEAELITFACDVADYSSAVGAVAETKATFGALNVLVSNAAIRHIGPLEETTNEDWGRLLETNLLGAVNFCRAAAADLRSDGRASVVIVSSAYAVVGRREMPIYDATKAALLSLMRSVAFDGAPDNIRVNAVCPGSTVTPYTLGNARARGQTEADLLAERKDIALLKRRATAEEIAYPILWLASDEASYITGATLMVDGGLSII
jgi:2-hydroxycyclohexanecarboxyl-CoA dehydrogenase